MQSTIIKEGYHWVISYEGDTYGLMPGALPEVLEVLSKGADEIILNLAGLDFLNPNGSKAFRESLEAARTREANLGIAAPQPQVLRALKMSGLVPDIPVYKSEKEAFASIDLVDFGETATRELTDRLLICQKELPIVGSLRKILKEHPNKPHYRIIPARSFKRAWEAIQKERVDCILIDSSWPLYQVTNFIDEINLNPRLPSIPVLIVATDDKLKYALTMIQNGAMEILRYPFKAFEVVIRLQTLICQIKSKPD